MAASPRCARCCCRPGGGQSIPQVVDEFYCALRGFDTRVGQGQFDRARVGGAGGAREQSEPFESAHQFRDVDGVETGEIGQSPLARTGAVPGQAVERGQHRVLGLGESVGREGAVEGGAPAGRQPPDQVADVRAHFILGIRVLHARHAGQFIWQLSGPDRSKIEGLTTLAKAISFMAIAVSFNEERTT